MFCSQCGASNADDALFCQKCGKRFETPEREEFTLLSPSPNVSSPYSIYGSSEPIPPPPPPILSYKDVSNPYQQPSAPSPRRRHLSPGLIIGAIFLLLAGSGGVYYATVFQPNQLRTQATATAQAQGTATSHARQVTATAQMTQTTIVVAQNSYPPFTGNLVLNDPLVDNTKGNSWQQSNDQFGGCRFSGNGYHVYEQDLSHYYDCVAFKTNFSNFIYEVNMRISKGDCGGLLFRMEGNLASFYHFVVCQNGTAMLERCDGSVPCISLLPFQSFSAIHVGENATNLIAVVADASSIILYANHQSLDHIVDDKHKLGKIGLEADPAQHNVTEVIYSDAKVWTL